MNTIKVMKLKDATVGDIVKVSYNDCWKKSTDYIIYAKLVGETVYGIVTDIKTTSLHEHPYLVIETKYGRVYVKKGGW